MYISVSITSPLYYSQSSSTKSSGKSEVGVHTVVVLLGEELFEVGKYTARSTLRETSEALVALPFWIRQHAHDSPFMLQKTNLVFLVLVCVFSIIKCSKNALKHH